MVKVDDVELAKSKPEMAVDCTEPPYDPPPYVAIDNSGIEDQKAATGDKTWSDLSCGGKVWRISWLIIRICLVFATLYLFICSLDVLQGAFQLLAGRSAGKVFQDSELLNNPVCGLIIGVLVTVLVQSSSTSTSIVITMVASQVLSVRQSIPIIMGANIGTSVTNTIVSLTQSAERSVFRRSFSGATVHDMFNWCCVIILLPIEAISGFLYHMTKAMVKDMGTESNVDNPSFLQVITKPLTDEIIQIDKKVIYAIAENSDRQKYPMAKYYCKAVEENFQVCYTSPDDVNETLVQQVNAEQFATKIILNSTTGRPDCNTSFSWSQVNDSSSEKCNHLFVGVGVGNGMQEVLAGAILLILSLFFMIVCLLMMVKLLNSLLQGPMAKVVHKFINSDFPGYAKHLTGYVAILVGAGMTILVQSSSVFTSALTPLVGLGIISIERMYPLTLGANIGTTITGILAALTSDPDRFQDSIQLAFCHLFFNVIGIVIFYPIPLLRRFPIFLAKKLGSITERYRWFAVVYLVCVFFIIPCIILGLSIAGIYVLIGVGVPILVLIIVVVIINLSQNKCPGCLPSFLKTWDFLPRPLRSLEPYDKVVTMCCANKTCKKVCKCCYADDFKELVDDASVVIDMKPAISTTSLGDPQMINSISNGHVNQAFEVDNIVSVKL